MKNQTKKTSSPKKQEQQEPQNPLILRAHRLMDAFAKSDEERDFYIDRKEGFIIYVNLDKSEEELQAVQKELENNPDRYCTIPKLSFFETKKIMEGFVNEKVYDIDTKERLLDIISSKEARENFLEFIYDHHTELEKWQQYYQERSRIRIIEWLRKNHYHFVFEEDLDVSGHILEKVKTSLFEKKVNKDVEAARRVISAKAKTYYSSEALNPRPKRGRPPKQIAKNESEPQMTIDIFLTVPSSLQLFLFTPDISSAADVTFSSKFESREELMANIRQEGDEQVNELETIAKRLDSLRAMTKEWQEQKSKIKEAEAAETVAPKKGKEEMVRKKSLKKEGPIKTQKIAKKTAAPKKNLLRRTKTKES